MPSTRVAVVDDHELVRIGLKQIIEAESDFAWVGDAATGQRRVRDAAQQAMRCAAP